MQQVWPEAFLTQTSYDNNAVQCSPGAGWTIINLGYLRIEFDAAGVARGLPDSNIL